MRKCLCYIPSCILLTSALEWSYHVSAQRRCARPSYHYQAALSILTPLYAYLYQDKNRLRADRAEEASARIKTETSQLVKAMELKCSEAVRQAQAETGYQAQRAASASAQAEAAKGLLGELGHELHDLTVYTIPALLVYHCCDTAAARLLV